MIETLWVVVRMMNMNKKILLKLLLISVSTFVISGCSALKEGLASQMEVPTLENQANRVAVGMTIVRENNIMAFKMPISADAKWPTLVSSEINDADRKFVETALMGEPYFSTAHYTKALQRKMLGSGALMSQFGDMGALTAMVLDKTVTPLTYRAVKKLKIFYGDDKKNWPNVFNYDSSLDNFLDFKDGNFQDIDSPTGDVYETIGEAVIALAPVNLQKDLTEARIEMLDGYADVASIKALKGQLETQLKADMAETSAAQKKNKHYDGLSVQEKQNIRQELDSTESQIKEAESLANEKELIYFQLLDEFIVSLESDINVDDENYVKLARNINIVSNEIQVGATEAYTSFGLALSNIAANNIVLNFPTELESLAIAKMYVPMNLQANYNERVGRLVKNAIYLLPNIFIGTYYAHKQSNLAEKYESLTEIILLAAEIKAEQEAEAKEAQEEVDKEAQEKKV